MLKVWRAAAPYRRRVASEYRRSASVVSFNHDGLEIARVKRRRKSGWLPLWHFMVFLYLILLIRLVALADIGPAGYASRMSEMSDGTVLERAAARVMAMDPLSRRLAAELRAILDVVTIR